MRSLQQFYELVENVCNCRQMFVCGGSFYEVCAYVQGYASAMEPYPLGQDHQTSFNVFVTTRLGYPQKLRWPYVLKTATQSDQQAIVSLRDLLFEYINALREDRLTELIVEAWAELESREQDLSEQVVCWRQFSRALHRGDENALKRLILDHENASALWESAFPDDIVPLMDEIGESYSIPVVSLSADGLESQIMSPDFGLIGLEKVDGKWRIDATPIIRCRLANARQKDA